MCDIFSLISSFVFISKASADNKKPLGTNIAKQFILNSYDMTDLAYYDFTLS